MSYYIYDNQAAAQIDADAINAAYGASVVDVCDGEPVTPKITQEWGRPIECVEGWALAVPPEPFRALATATVSVEGVAPLNQE